MDTRESRSPDLSVADKLDDEIANLRAQVESLKRELQLQTSTLMTSESTKKLLQPDQSRRQRSKQAEADSKEKLLARAHDQTTRKQQCLYRTCASITTFKIRDPDPNAVDEGNVLGVRLEVMSKSRFLRPYYVMLNRPYSNRRYLRVHRHTVPQCIPLAGLAARYLSAPGAKGDDGEPKKQDLSQFVRALRREIVRYHNRTSVIGDLRKSAGLESKTEKSQELEVPIVDISAADAEAKQISVEWSDGRSGRLVMGDDGNIVKMVVQGENGRDRDAVRQLLGGSVRIEEVVKKLEGV
ncbi:cenp-O kinetochore centromere component [Biscogniauxia mediterranea]|nr:cenp-O kinetochore centromere component [Biscogniauxia mediterranea]